MVSRGQRASSENRHLHLFLVSPFPTGALQLGPAPSHPHTPLTPRHPTPGASQERPTPVPLSTEQPCLPLSVSFWLPRSSSQAPPGTNVSAEEKGLFSSFLSRDPRILATRETGYANPASPKMQWEPGNQEGGRRLS